MNTESIMHDLRILKTSAKKYAPELRIAIGTLGLVSAGIIGIKDTPKAIKLMEKEEKEKGDKLTKEEVVQTCWKTYIPAASIAIISTCCIASGSKSGLQRSAALATAYKIAESSYSEYKNKVVSTIGERKEQTIKDVIAKDQVAKNPVKNTEIIMTDKGNTLCMDSVSGRYFRSNIEKIKAAVNTVNRNLTQDMYVSLNEFYYEIGLPGTSIGDEIGWNLDKGLIDISYSSQLTEDGEPCLVINYDIAPRYDFSKLD